jgi:hypothetical protein
MKETALVVDKVAWCLGRDYACNLKEERKEGRKEGTKIARIVECEEERKGRTTLKSIKCVL